MTNDLHLHYQAVLTAERQERERIVSEIKRLQQQLKQKDDLLAALTATLAVYDAAQRGLAKPLPFPQPVGLGAPAPTALFVGISVRWAILSLMSDYAKEPLATAELAEALAAGGVRSGGVNFTSNVSAVVSDMVKNRNELEQVDTKYRITPHGREVWASIKGTRRYKQRRFEVPAMGKAAPEDKEQLN